MHLCMQQQQLDVIVEVGDEQQHRCIVISGPGVQQCSITQAFLTRCGHRGFVLRSKLLLGRRGAASRVSAGQAGVQGLLTFGFYHGLAGAAYHR